MPATSPIPNAICLVEAARLSPNPRRRPAHESVSLGQPSWTSCKPHAAPSKPILSPSQASSRVDDLKGSGESSNAESWFDHSNNHLRGASSAFVGNDSPFSFRHASNGSPPARAGTADDIQSSSRLLLTQGNSTGSGSEEYRGVIDDLTIENQALKQKLKHYEKLHNSPQDSDKLFEVRVHGLPPARRRELEETLRKFTMALNDHSDTEISSSEMQSYPAPMPALMKPTSTMGGVTDSGYGSMSASLQASSNRSKQGGRDINSRSATKARVRNIHSYLHDIPESLLPYQTPVMDERTKKKVVVRRLEQIFGGTQAAVEGHQQPLQQQEVSQSAARADRSASEAKGQRATVEGMREAKIMMDETEDPMDLPAVTQHLPSQENIGEQDFAAPVSKVQTPPIPEQRPTRPLDLDLHRAQDPSENIEYIRHLGVKLENMSSSNELFQSQDWVYLNLVMGMAQLHTLNVTTEFVKLALSEGSKKLELSKDGRKIRWRGERGVADSASSPDKHASTNKLTGIIGLKRARSAYEASESCLQLSVQPNKKQVVLPSVDRFKYTPMFAKQEDSSDDTYMMDDDLVTKTPLSGAKINSAVTKQKNPMSGLARDGGPIIFYNNVKFCIDLGGDGDRLSRATRAVEYHAYTSNPIGVAPKLTRSSVKSRHGAPGVLSRASSSRVAEFLEHEFEDIEFPAPVVKHVTFIEPVKPLDLEVSGIGGIRSDDNLAITVVRQRTAVACDSPIRTIARTRLDALVKRKQPLTVVAEKILSVREETLQPSTLPPPTFAMLQDDSEDESNVDSTESILGDAELRVPILPPLAFTSSGVAAMRSHASMSADGSESQCDSDDDMRDDHDSHDDDDDDQSLDFLATARAADPEAIRAREREYDAEMAERLAEEIRAGSSAATLGGGSGYNSPASAGDESDDEDDAVAACGSFDS